LEEIIMEPECIDSAPVKSKDEQFVDKLEKFFNGYFETFVFHDFLGGINAREIISLGESTIRGMIMFIAEYKLPESIGHMEHCCLITKERDSPEKECLDLISYLHSLLESPGLSNRPCLPVFRMTYQHFKKGVEVMVFYNRKWVPGTIITPVQPTIVPYSRNKSKLLSFMNSDKNSDKLNVNNKGIFAPDSIIAFRPELRVEIGGDEPQLVDILHCDASIFKKDEYQYIVSDQDPEFLHILQENMKDYKYGLFRDCSLQVKAVAELVRIVEDAKLRPENDDELMVLFDKVWVRAKIVLPENGNIPAVVELLGDAPMTLPINKDTQTLSIADWKKMNAESKDK
jgi:hypothetical protein